MADLKMPTLNLVMLAGRLVADPELRYTPKGTAVCTFRLAVSRYYRDRDAGEFKEEVGFFSIVVWDRMAEMAGERLRKGSAVIVEGMLRSRSYEAQDGNKRYVVEIVSRRLQFLDKAPSAAATPQEDADTSDYGGEDPFSS